VSLSKIRKKNKTSNGHKIYDMTGYALSLNNDNNKFITIDLDTNTINFKIQNGPIKENGINGCQVDDIIEVARMIIEEFNVDFPCGENAIVLTLLDEAVSWLKKRKDDRIRRGVEGTNQK